MPKDTGAANGDREGEVKSKVGGQQGERNRRINWGTVAALMSGIGAIGALLISAWSFHDSAKSFEQSTSLQASIAATQALQNHYEYSAREGVGIAAPSGGLGVKEYSSDLKLRRTIVAQHGFFTANIIFDVTEGTDEERQWKS